MDSFTLDDFVNDSSQDDGNILGWKHLNSTCWLDMSRESSVTLHPQFYYRVLTVRFGSFCLPLVMLSWTQFASECVWRMYSWRLTYTRLRRRWTKLSIQSRIRECEVSVSLHEMWSEPSSDCFSILLPVVPPSNIKSTMMMKDIHSKIQIEFLHLWVLNLNARETPQEDIIIRKKTSSESLLLPQSLLLWRENNIICVPESKCLLKTCSSSRFELMIIKGHPKVS